MSNPAYLKDTELAARWNVSRDSIWRWNRLGKIPAPVKLGDNCTRWKLTHVEAWETERESAA